MKKKTNGICVEYKRLWGQKIDPFNHNYLTRYLIQKNLPKKVILKPSFSQNPIGYCNMDCCEIWQLSIIINIHYTINQSRNYLAIT